MKNRFFFPFLLFIVCLYCNCKTDSGYGFNYNQNVCYADSIFVKDTSVYITGFCENNNIFWKDGLSTDQATFSAGIAPGQSIQSGTITYLKNDSTTRTYKGGIGVNPYYTIDDENIVFLEAPGAGTVDSIYISSDNMYAAGTYGSTVDCGGIFYNACYYPYKACYWKNGIRKDLLNIDDSYYINSIYVSGDTTIITGSQYLGFSFYWHDDVFKQLSPIDKTSGAFGAYIFNTDVYIAGYYYDDSAFPLACYWKNTIRTNIENNTYSQAYGIYILNNSVYAAGFYMKDGTQHACYWQDGVRFDLPKNQ